MNTWSIVNVMDYTGLTYQGVVKMCAETNVPMLPRRKGEAYIFPRLAFIKWWKGGQYEAKVD